MKVEIGAEDEAAIVAQSLTEAIHIMEQYHQAGYSVFHTKAKQDDKAIKKMTKAMKLVRSWYAG
jgi:2-methylisocitrate lyase-like PEP mutase family enzyme